MGDNAMMVTVGVILVFPFVFYFLKSWLFATGTPGSTAHRVRRIADLDGHLSFDERLAEQLRVVGQEHDEAEPSPPPEPAAPTPAPAPAPSATSPLAPKGFGRRGL